VISSRSADIDSTINQVYGYVKQGAEYGYTTVRGPTQLSLPVVTVLPGWHVPHGADQTDYPGQAAGPDQVHELPLGSTLGNT